MKKITISAALLISTFALKAKDTTHVIINRNKLIGDTIKEVVIKVSVTIYGIHYSDKSIKNHKDTLLKEIKGGIILKD